MSSPRDDFAQMWAWFATHCHDYSPLYERISAAVADDPQLLDWVRSAPPDAHLPPALLAAVHYLLLETPEHPLADVYAGRSDADPAPLFLQLCRDRGEEVMQLLTTRRIQTNDCGRSALIAPGLTWLAHRIAAPMALVDVGASAGLNLLCDRYRIDYGPAGATGPRTSSVHIDCRVAGGQPPIAAALPTLVSRIGIDRSPIDLGHPDDARWLLACVWPDTGRLERTAASIHLAQGDPPPVIAGDGNDALPGVLGQLPPGAAAVIVTTWAFAYFSLDDRERFVQILEAASHTRTIAWLSAEGLGTVAAIAGAPGAADADAAAGADVLGAAIFERGAARWELLGLVQEHGAWIDWRAPA
jgi:hypothetical protein